MHQTGHGVRCEVYVRKPVMPVCCMVSRAGCDRTPNEPDAHSPVIAFITVTTEEGLRISLTGRIDGRDTPVGGAPFADTVAYLLQAPRVIEGVATMSGPMCVEETAVLSEPGNTVIVTNRSVAGVGAVVEHIGHGERVSQHG